MTHLVSVESLGKVIRVKALDRMGMATYEHLVPFIDSAIEEYDAARLLFDLTQFAGREAGAVFEDAEFSLPHWAQVDRVAFIGDKQFEPRLQAFCQPFISATIRFFHPNQRSDAEHWIHERVE